MKMERLIGILSILLQRDKVTAPELAEQFEVSRDIESLCQAGIPIATAQGTGGGISILEGYRVDRTVLTTPEMQAILAGLQSLDSVSGTRRYAQLMEKLSAGSGGRDSHILIDLSSWYKTSLSPKIEAIHSAIRQHQTIRFTYFSPRETALRTIEPYDLVFQWSSWYVWGWCQTRQDFRLFKLNRMTDLVPGLRRRICQQSASSRQNIRSLFFLTPPAAGGWWRNTGRTVSLSSQMASCGSPGAFPMRTASSTGF